MMILVFIAAGEIGWGEINVNLYGILMSEKSWKEGVKVDELQVEKGLELDSDLDTRMRDMVETSRRGGAAI